MVAMPVQPLLWPETSPKRPKKAGNGAIAAVKSVPERAHVGDIWACGAHRVLCGDSTDAEAVARLLAGARVSACVTDPPYGVKWRTNYRQRFTGGLSDKRRNWPRVTGDAAPFNPEHLLGMGFKRLVLWGANCYSDRLPRGSWLVWDKRFKNGKAFLADAEVAWMNRGHGVYIHSLTQQGFVRPEREIWHPTQKPIALLEWCLEKVGAGVTVYDPYCGSGTMLLACERTHRRCYGVEIEPGYVDVALHRWEQATGHTATLLERNG